MRPADDDFDGEEVERLELLANQLAIAIQNARDYREKLEQAIRDPLTGVYNRRFFFEALEKEVARRERYGSPVSLVIFDIDDFKAINDTFGHAVGDDALRKVTPDRGEPDPRRSTASPGSAARSSACCCPRPSSSTRCWWPTACAPPSPARR